MQMGVILICIRADFFDHAHLDYTILYHGFYLCQQLFRDIFLYPKRDIHRALRLSAKLRRFISADLRPFYHK
jgi:hypothetical protein